MCGFGGSIWQTWFLVKTLNGAGYDVTALDFSETVLSEGDPDLLLGLVEEVVMYAEAEARKTAEPILLIGISLGALMTLNILRRSELFDVGIGITGGDIVKVAQNIYGMKVWPQPYEELAATWQGVNIYSEPSKLAGKRLLFVLPERDKLIDPNDVREEVGAQAGVGNRLTLIERPIFGHIGTIVMETILFPKRVLRYIRQIEAPYSLGVGSDDAE